MIAISSGMSAAALRSVNESLRDDLARLRLLADSVRTNPGRAGDLRASSHNFCDTFLVQHEAKDVHLYSALRPDAVDRLISSHRLIVVQLARIRHADVTDLPEALAALAGLLDDHLRSEEEQLPLSDGPPGQI
ncbi:hemerythrin domain-containing protein [Kribbella sp. NPDC049584]|uniref:hemerythrin domain-containing protein n=1 Tax=Kribbella sp. NPDC049584 TaxID=3154833 RepID=UPI0034162EA8